MYLIGRRGPLQAAFTIKELREMLKLKNCNTVWRPNDFKDIGNDTIAKLARPRKRITELMLKSVQEQNESKNGNNVFNPIFLRSPIEILGKDNNVEKLVLGVNVLEGEDLANQNARLTDERETIDCGLVVSSIGMCYQYYNWRSGIKVQNFSNCRKCRQKYFDLDLMFSSQLNNLHTNKLHYIKNG